MCTRSTTPQSASAPYQRCTLLSSFEYTDCRTCPGMSWAGPFCPQNCGCPSRVGIWTPSNVCFLGPTRVHIPNGVSVASVFFAQLMAESLYTLQWVARFPSSKLPLHTRIWTPPSNTWFLGPTESISQTASLTDKGFTSHSIQNMSFRRCSSWPMSWLEA